MIDEDSIRMAVLSDNLDDVDYYALLEIERDATSEVIRDAFHDFALRFHPDQHVGDAASQRKALAIFKRGAEAYRVLMQPVLRARYDAARASGGIRLPTAAMQLPPDGSSDVEVPPAARAFFEKARALLQKGDHAAARMHLQLAAARGESPQFARLEREIAEAERK